MIAVREYSEQVVREELKEGLLPLRLIRCAERLMVLIEQRREGGY
jgi:hypothetical protein